MKTFLLGFALMLGSLFTSNSLSARAIGGGPGFQCNVGGVKVSCDFIQDCYLDSGEIKTIRGEVYCCIRRACFPANPRLGSIFVPGTQPSTSISARRGASAAR